jgi:hypothetical protein
MDHMLPNQVSNEMKVQNKELNMRLTWYSKLSEKMTLYSLIYQDLDESLGCVLYLMQKEFTFQNWCHSPTLNGTLRSKLSKINFKIK